MLPVKYLQVLRNTRNVIYEKGVMLGKARYSDKKKIVINVNKSSNEEQKCAKETLKSKTSDEIEKNAFDNEEEIMEVILTEKEKDASVTSRLSKECNSLIGDKKIRLTSSGLNLHIEQPSKSKETGWEGYGFSTTINALKKQALAPTVAATCKDGAGGGAPTSSSGNRITRGEPGKVLFALIPEEWWRFFIPKTGVTGFYTFLFTYGTYLISKEYYVLEHNFYGGLSMACIWYGAIRYVGPLVTKFLDKQVDDYEKAWEKGRSDSKKAIEEQLEDEHLVQLQADGQLMLLDAKRENVALQLEEEFRKRQMYVYEEVKKRLDYHVAVERAHKKIQHKNLIEYVTKEVHKSVTPDMQNKLINISIESIVTELGKGDKK